MTATANNVKTAKPGRKNAAPAVPVVEVTSAPDAQTSATVVKMPKPSKRDATPGFRKLEVGKVERVPLNVLKIEKGLNPRQFNPEDATDKLFARSLDSGIVKPVEVRQDDKGDIYVMDGHRRIGGARWRLSENPKLTALQTVPVLLVASDRTGDVGKRSGYVLTSASFRELTPMQKSVSAARMKAEGWEPKGIAAQAGVSKKFVEYLLEMAELPDSIKRFATADSDVGVGISSFLALQIVKEVGEERAVKAIQTAADNYVKKHGYGSHIHLSRKHLHAVDAGIPAQVGGATETRAPQQTTAKTEPGAKTEPAKTEGDKPVEVSAHTRAAVTEKLTTLAGDPAPAAPAKPATDLYRAVGMGIACGGTRFLTATSMPDAEALAAFLNLHGFTRPAK